MGCIFLRCWFTQGFHFGKFLLLELGFGVGKVWGGLKNQFVTRGHSGLLLLFFRGRAVTVSFEAGWRFVVHLMLSSLESCLCLFGRGFPSSSVSNLGWLFLPFERLYVLCSPLNQNASILQVCLCRWIMPVMSFLFSSRSISSPSSTSSITTFTNRNMPFARLDLSNLLPDPSELLTYHCLLLCLFRPSSLLTPELAVRVDRRIVDFGM